MAKANRRWTAPSAEADEKVSKKRTRFYKLAPNSTTLVRFMPSTHESGRTFTPVVNHFNLKDAEGNNVAPACLKDLKGEACPACAASEVLRKRGKAGDKLADRIGRELGGRARYYAEFYVKGDEDAGPQMTGFAQTMYEDLVAVGKTCREGELGAYNHPDEGQWIALRREGSGFDTKYSANLTGKFVTLDEVRKQWEDEMTVDFIEAIAPREVSQDEMVDLMKHTFGGDVDFDDVLGK